MSEMQDSTGNAMGFPQLKTCGGFEMMRCTSNCRDLTVINCSWNAKDLHSSLGDGQGKVYLRPIQRSLATSPMVQQSRCEIKEVCQMCNKEVLVRNLREHLWACTEGLDSDESSDPPSVPQSSSVLSSVPQASSSSTAPPSVPEQFSSSTAPPSVPEQSSSSTAPPSVPEQSSSSPVFLKNPPHPLLQRALHIAPPRLHLFHPTTETRRVATVDLTQRV
ncbi:Hypothetical predicted protein [Paramuricea clavata]|uniref:Uncharacterized protein n=1 Tax=Paramuricea clavata TaxID=317549 RepID=A0A6S7GVB0_PARCT|nr:Hypothetical predicted protein [Paramuricea clavata]